MNFSFSSGEHLNTENLILLVSEDMKLPGFLSRIDQEGIIARAIKMNKAFSGKPGQILTVLAPHGMEQSNVFVVGLGGMQSSAMSAAGGAIAVKLNKMKVVSADLLIQTADGISDGLAVHLLAGIKLRNYSFGKYFVSKSAEHVLSLSQVNVVGDDLKDIQAQFLKQESVLDGTLLTRDLVSETPNHLFPIAFAEKCKELEKYGLKVKILDLAEMRKLKMFALLGVAQGSVNEPRVAIMEWHGNTADKTVHLGLVGKGVTFDSGGINLKHSSSIADMKYDMGGAGVVTGAMMSIAKRKAKANVVGIIGIVENMPSGTAQRPSDVVVSMSGQTIEVDNTDAEGRLVLADVMWYLQEKYQPKRMVDLATLTGAIVVSLGDYYAGLFSNDGELSKQLVQAGAKVGEHLWPMPLHEHYDKQINSDIADVKNVGQNTRGGGSIAAAQFLKRFVKDTVWAHLDIAGVTWTKFGSDACPKGATGFGVRLLNQYITDNLEGDI